MKKVISTLLVIVMCISILSTFAFALQFSDVSDTAWYYNAVQWAVEKGVTNGTTATTFAPKMTCDRSQAVTFMWNAAGKPEPANANNPFTDVKETAWYYKAILWAVEKGITNGTTATTFSPTMKCDRSQIVTFLWKSAGKPAPKNSTNPFTDVKDTSWYYQAILWAVENKVTNGTSATTFSPTMTCDRSQIVTFLYNYFKNKTTETPSTPETPEVCTHTYDNDCDTTCNKCSAIREVSHAFDNDCDKECNVCSFTRTTRHNYGDNSANCINCGNPAVSVSAKITLDKTVVKVGDTLKPAVTVTGGVAPYTAEWSYIDEVKHVIEGATTLNPTITVTDEMFDDSGKINLSCTVTDAEGCTDTVDEYATIDKLLDLSITLADISGLKKTDFQAVGGELVAVFNLNATVTGANPDECTYKWEWAPVSDGIHREIYKEVPSGGNHDFIIAKQTNDKVNAPSALVKHSFLDKPVLVKVTVTDSLGRTASSVKMLYRNLNGSTGSYNVVGYTHTVTPKGGDGNYQYTWSYSAPGESGLFEEFDPAMYTCSGNQLSMGIELHRILYNIGVRKIICTITSAGVSETVEFSFS